MNDQSAEAEIHRLREKLELAIHYLTSLAFPGRAEGLDVIPEGWDVSVGELIQLLSPNEDEFERRIREGQEFLKSLEEAGWKRSTADGPGTVLYQADDPAIEIFFNPHTGEQLLSPKLMERLKQQVERGRDEAKKSDSLGS